MILADYLTPITGGLTPQPAGTGRLSRGRSAALDARLHELDDARKQASREARSYLIRGGAHARAEIGATA